jgi:hypothetical protein
MGWIVAAVVVVVLGALTWWSSGRARPLGRRFPNPNRDAGYSAARAEVDRNRTSDRLGNGPGGFGGV